MPIFIILFLKRIPDYESPLKIHASFRILAISTDSWHEESQTLSSKIAQNLKANQSFLYEQLQHLGLCCVIFVQIRDLALFLTSA